MSELASEVARKRVAEAISAIEKKTAAEVVVAMRPAAGDYRHADLVAGAVTAVVLLCVFLYHPEEFDFTYFPLEQAAAFFVGAFACAHLPPLRRLFAGSARRASNVETAAKVLFVDRGITKTRARTGVLVYVAAFERDAVVVLDVGLDESKLGLASTRAALRAAVRAGDLDAFLVALASIGERLAAEYPVTADDVDELPNEVAA